MAASASTYVMLASLLVILLEAAVVSAGSPTASPQGNLGLDLSKLNQRVTGKGVNDMFPDGMRKESPSPLSSSPSSSSKQDGPRSYGKSKKSRSHSAPPPSSPPPSQVIIEEAPTEPVVVEPPPPVVIPTPPFPFKFAGVQRQLSGQTIYFLIKDNKLYTVEVGQILDSVYSIDGEEGGQLNMTYLPLDRKQTISMGSAT
ncbi:MAG: hypothetical protein CAF43_008715 [Nitrospira sp. CG24C]|nr:MAG: hypothetical protein CAF43_008715 [Nitrospira sp. CG24C]